MSSVYYGKSGDCRSDFSAGLPSTHQNYQGEDELPGNLIERGRRNAYALINAKLTIVYPSKVPWTSGSEPDLIYEISNKLAMCFVYKRKNPGPAPIDKKVKAEFCDEPMKLLDDIANLDIQLPETGDPLGANRVFHTRDEHPVFDIDDTLNQGPSSELLSDIEDARDD